MRVRFWGVRGSIAGADAAMAEVGGNTSCVEVQAGRHTLVFDAGTGLRGLGADLMRRDVRAVHLFLSHTHWDHIQGVPFFAPAYAPGRQVSFYAHRRHGLALRRVLEGQMAHPYFPVTMDAMHAQLRFDEMNEREEVVLGGEVRVRCEPLNHPDGVVAYRVDYAGASFVFATDTEHYAVPDPRLLDLARGADVLVYDAQYTPEEYAGAGGRPARIGWGHSTWEEGVKVARAADVGQLVLFHHDPTHDDAAVAAIERAARERFAATVAAREGHTLAVEPRVTDAGGRPLAA